MPTLIVDPAVLLKSSLHLAHWYMILKKEIILAKILKSNNRRERKHNQTKFLIKIEYTEVACLSFYAKKPLSHVDTNLLYQGILRINQH